MPAPRTRRDLLRAAAGAAGLAVGAHLLSACGDDPPEATAAGAGGGQPRQGGTLRAAIAGGGAAETLNPFTRLSPLEFARSRVIWDVLFAQVDGQSVARLAMSATAAPDGRSFTLKLREGVRWQDGTPFTAKDVVFTLRTLVAPEQKFPSLLTAYLDAAAMKATDELTVTVPLKQPVGDPAALLAVAETCVVKDGTTAYTVDSAIGTGPYRVTSAQAGQSSTVRRFDGHWDGSGHLDEITFLSLPDPQARVNAVQSGQADFATAISYTAAKLVPQGKGLEVRTAGERERTGFGMILNTALPPFADPRARKAVRLAVDRKQLVDTIFLGYGVPGNDLYGAGAQFFAGDLAPLSRDVDGARALLREAGAEGAKVVIRCAETEGGVTASVNLLAEQLKAVGLAVAAQAVSLAEFQDLAAMGRANAVAFSIAAFPLQTIYPQLSLLPSLSMKDTEIQKATATAIATPDAGQREKAWRAIQDAYYDRGNLLVWGFGDTLSLARANLRGVEARGAAKYPFLGKAWLA